MANELKMAKTLSSKMTKQSKGDLSDISTEMTAMFDALSRARIRMAEIKSATHAADAADGDDNPFAYERVFQTLNGLEREVGNAEAAIRNIVVGLRQLNTIAVQLEEGEPNNNNVAVPARPARG